MLLSWLFLTTPPGVAQSLSLQDLYINPISEKQPEAIILYSTANPCLNCNKAIDMLVEILRKNYKNRLHAYLINLARHPEFIDAFKIKSPLTLVIVRISDGASFGYEKLEDLQSQTDAPTAFDNRVREFINDFLGWN